MGKYLNSSVLAILYFSSLGQINLPLIPSLATLAYALLSENAPTYALTLAATNILSLGYELGKRGTWKQESLEQTIEKPGEAEIN